MANQTLQTNSNITENWDGGYKLELDIIAESNADNWTLDFELPYNISAAYGVDFVRNSNGSYTIKGQDGWSNLNEGQSIKSIFIIEDNGNKTKVPKFNLQNTQQINTVAETESITDTSSPAISNSDAIQVNAVIAEDWEGGYKLELDITAESNADNWTLDFELPYSISEAYGADFVKNNSSYTIKGQDGWSNLSKGQSIKSIFIIEDNGQKAKIPEFNLQGSQISTVDRVEPITEIPTPVVSDSTPIRSSNGIAVGFENHANNTTYGSNAQSKDWNVGFSSGDMNQYAVISNEEAYSGNQSLKITYPDNTQLNAGAGWKIPDAKEYYLSYQVKFADNFDFNGKYGDTSGGKLPGLGAGDLWSGGGSSDGTKGFTSRPMWREDGKAILYLYHMDKPGVYGEDILLKGNDGNDTYFQPGKWHNITQRVRINDGNQSNGEVDMWMDGEQVLSMGNLQFVTNGQEIDTAFFNTFHGGFGSDWWPENDVNAYFDDFVVSTNSADVGL